jgi:acyltransferase
MVAFSDREWWIDYAKAIGIFLVVFIHLITSGYFKTLTYSINMHILLLGEIFAMPLFFFISGYLYRDIKPKIALNKYFKRLIIPYLAFYFIGAMVIIFINGYYKNLNIILQTTGKLLPSLIITDPSASIFPANGPIWFLLALFIVIMLFSIMMKYFKNYKYIFIAILGLNTLLFILHSYHINWIYLALDSAILGLMFFFAGHLTKKYDIIRIFRNNYINVIIVLAFFALSYLELTYNGGLAFRAGNWSGNIILSYMGGFAGIMMVIAFSSILSKFKFMLIYWISISTLIIMCLDQPIRSILVPLTRGILVINGHNLSYLVFMTITIILISLPIYYSLNKHIPVIVGNKTPIKIQIDNLNPQFSLSTFLINLRKRMFN